MHKQAHAIISTMRAVLRSCQHTGHGTMVYQATKHHHVYNAVIMHLVCHAH